MDSSEFNRLIEKYIDVVFRSALSFCVRVAANESKTLWRSVWHRKVVSFSNLDVEPAYMDSEKGEMLTEVMRLPKKYSAVLHLHYYEAYTCSEIASILGISESNVQTRLMRARNMLKERLGEAWL